MKIREAAGLMGKGLFAGAMGTAAITASTMIETKLTGRKPDTTPADAAVKVLPIREPVSDEERQRLANRVHWAYGTSLGIPRAALGATGLPAPAATLVHFAGVWGAGLTMRPALKVAPPVKEWGAKQIAADGWHHLSYAVAASLAYHLAERAPERLGRARRHARGSKRLRRSARRRLSRLAPWRS
ncbi:MAG: hypothetical protein ACRDJG_03020 [Actinomycetota bacterium]